MGDIHAPDCDCDEQTHSDDHDHFAERAVDNSSWDGPAAMSKCSSSSTPASCYSSICAGRKSGPPDQQSSWALPHHKSAGGPPNAAGVRNALARLSQTQGLTNAEAARRHLEAHMSAISPSNQKSASPPRDNLFRAIWLDEGVVQVRAAADGDSGPPVLYGHFAVFNRWTEIDSIFEGRFMEQIAPGAFKKTFAENRNNIKVLFQHGQDPQLANKVLGPIDELKEDETGAYYEVPLYRGIPDLILEGLRDGQYGASFRFRVTREELDNEPGRSKDNPEGIPERTVREVELKEFGPVTFPAYSSATAGLRSITDEIVFGRYLEDPERLRELLTHVPMYHAVAPPPADAEAPHLSDGRRIEPPKRGIPVIRNPNRRRS